MRLLLLHLSEYHIRLLLLLLRDRSHMSSAQLQVLLLDVGRLRGAAVGQAGRRWLLLDVRFFADQIATATTGIVAQLLATVSTKTKEDFRPGAPASSQLGASRSPVFGFGCTISLASILEPIANLSRR